MTSDQQPSTTAGNTRESELFVISPEELKRSQFACHIFARGEFDRFFVNLSSKLVLTHKARAYSLIHSE